jgi:hypothetical protein
MKRTSLGVPKQEIAVCWNGRRSYLYVRVEKFPSGRKLRLDKKLFQVLEFENTFIVCFAEDDSEDAHVIEAFDVIDTPDTTAREHA